MENVVKYLQNKNVIKRSKNTISGNLRTSDGILINRGRVYSTTNASTSSQSNSKTRKNLGGLSHSVDRKNPLEKNNLPCENLKIPNSSNILIQDFVVNLTPNNVENYSKEQNKRSFDNKLKTQKSNFVGSKNELSFSNLRKSQDFLLDKRMNSEGAKTQ